jgi:hypothetical protein
MSIIDAFFAEMLKDLKCDYATRAYVISIFTKYKSSKDDYSKDSLTLLFARAKEYRDFYLFQGVADWLFFTRIMTPRHLRFADEKYYLSLAQISYINCYYIVNRQMKLYQELADTLPELEKQTKQKLSSIRII